jgi:uncharacterized protein YybS (DUF2232 family)
MELDNLKDLWQQQAPERVPGDLQQLLGKKSNSPISKMKRNLVCELGFVVVIYGLSIIFFFTAWEGKFSSVSWLYLVIGFIFSVYFLMKYRLLNGMECMACQVKSNLDKQVSILEKYIRFYLIAGTAILPLMMIFFYWFLQTQLRYVNRDFFVLASENIPVLRSIFTWTFATLVLTFLFYFLNKWYVKKLYGKHVSKLKSMLSQMDDDISINNQQ